MSSPGDLMRLMGGLKHFRLRMIVLTRFSQTLFRPLDEIKAIELIEGGYGKGAFVVVRSLKQ